MADKTSDADASRVAALLPRCRIEWSGNILLPKFEKHSPPVGEAVDLLPLIDPEIHSRNGQWEIQDGALLSPTGRYMSLELPILPAAEYRIDATVERIQGRESFAIGIVAGENTARILLEGYERLSGLDTIAQKDLQAQATKYQQPIFTAGKPTKIVIEVSPSKVLATCDNKTVVDWQGDSRELSIGDYGTEALQASPRSLFLNTYESRYRITKLTYTALDDAAAGEE